MEHTGTKQHKFIQFFPIMAAALLTLLVCYCIFYSSLNRQSHAYQVVILGDSIMGKEREINTVDQLMRDKTGLTIFNGAFGGTCATAGNQNNRYDYHEDSLNLTRLVDAICSRDFAVALADVPNNQYKADYFTETLRELSMIDFGRVDYVIIQHGSNDYAGARPLENPEDPYDIYSFGGALRYAISQLEQHYPNLEIILVTPTFCWFEAGLSCREKSYGYGTMEVYAAKKIEIAREYDLALIDPYHELDFNKENFWTYTDDGMHLNEPGRLIYGNYVGEQLHQIAQRGNGS